MDLTYQIRFPPGKKGRRRMKDYKTWLLDNIDKTQKKIIRLQNTIAECEKEIADPDYDAIDWYATKYQESPKDLLKRCNIYLTAELDMLECYRLAMIGLEKERNETV